MERNEHQARIEHLNSVLRAIRNVNQLIVREKDPGRLLQQACELLVETRGYRGAWIAVGDPDQPPIHLVQAGWGELFEALREALHRGEYPPCRALAAEGGLAVITPDSNCGGCPLQTVYGDGRAMVTVLRHGDQRLGMLGVRLPAGTLIDDEERSLLIEVAGDLAFALDSIRIEGRLRESEAENAALYDSAPVLLLTVDGDRRVRKANRLAIEAGGGAEIRGKRGGEALRCVHSLDDPRGCGYGPACATCEVRRTVVDTLERGVEHRQVPATVGVLDEGGHEREVFFLVSSVPVTLGGERLAHVCLMDVTERTRGEQRYQLLIDHMLNGIALCRMIFDGDRPVDFAYEMVNPAFEKQTGLVDVAGKAVSEVIPGILERDPELFEIYGRVVKTGTPEHFELYLESLKMWFEVSVFRPQQGYFAAVFDVVTERKQAEEALRRSENKYRTLLENLSQRIFLKDRESVYVSCNESYARDLGIRADEIAGRTDFDFYPRGLAEKYRGDDQRLMHEGKTEDLEERYLLDGQERWVHTIKTPVRDATGKVTGILGIFWDITRQRDTERQLNQAQRLESVGRLAGGVAHDFNNLLSVVISYSGCLLDELRESEPVRGDILEIQKAGQRAAALTRQLLAFSRKQVLEPEVLCINIVVSGIESMLRRLLGEDIDIEVRLAEGLGSVMADPGQLEQVIMNLAVNARDAMPEGGRLTIETANVELDEGSADQHAALEPGRFVLLSVTDTGTGMDAETQANIFEPFFTTKEQGKGTGLGLSTAYGIVKQSGGNIWVYSEPGRGTTFKVYLPRVEAPAVDVKCTPTTAMATGNETVLIVEDEDPVLKVAERILRKAGYSVLSAANGGEALLLCEKHGAIDLLLTDVVMPNMSGRELSERLATMCPKLKVLYMSGYTENAIVHHGVLDPGTRFIGKPFTAADLTRKVREALDESAHTRR